MALLNAIYSWATIKALNTGVLSMNLAGIVALVFALVWAIRLERGFAAYLNLVTPGNGHVWAAAILAASLVCAPAYCLGVKIYLQLRLDWTKADLEETSVSVDDGHETNRLLLVHAVICLVSGVLVAILNAACLVRPGTVQQQKSRNGLYQAIENYGNDPGSKSRIDKVQAELECCGDQGYVDWFRVPWTRTAEGFEEENDEDSTTTVVADPLEGQSETEPGLMNADVPFSCCSNDNPRPCVHHDILRASSVYEYDPKYLTISTVGCRSRILERAQTIRYFSIGYLGLLSVYQVALSLFSRLLQTAHSNDFRLGPEKSRYHSWIFCRTIQSPDESLLRAESGGGLATGSTTGRKFPVSDSSRESSGRPIGRRKRRRSDTRLYRSYRARETSGRAAKSLSMLRSSEAFDSFNGERTASEEKRPQGEPEASKEDQTKKDPSEVQVPMSGSGSTAIVDLPPAPPLVDFERDSGSSGIATRNVDEQEADVREDTGSWPEEEIISGRLRVLERFGNLCGQEEIGAATDHQLVTRRVRDWGRPEVDSNLYDRFRGTLQHTLARREAIRTARLAGACTGSCSFATEERSTGVLARLRCKDDPPSCRILSGSGPPGGACTFGASSQRLELSEHESVPEQAGPPELYHRERLCTVCGCSTTVAPIDHRRSPREDYGW